MQRDETCGWRDSFFAVSLNEGFLRLDIWATGSAGRKNEGRKFFYLKVPYLKFNSTEKEIYIRCNYIVLISFMTNLYWILPVEENVVVISNFCPPLQWPSRASRWNTESIHSPSVIRATGLSSWCRLISRVIPNIHAVSSISGYGILDLLLSIINVSVKTVELVAGLSELKWE